MNGKTFFGACLVIQTFLKQLISISHIQETNFTTTIATTMSLLKISQEFDFKKNMAKKTKQVI